MSVFQLFVSKYIDTIIHVIVLRDECRVPDYGMSPGICRSELVKSKKKKIVYCGSNNKF